MATKTFYILGTAATSPDWMGNLQDGGSAPTAANSVFGWSANKLAIGTYTARLGATSTVSATGAAISSLSGPTKGTGSGTTTAGDSFTTPTPLTGTFASGAWIVSLMLRASVAGCIGHLNMRVWASANQDGTSARQLGSNVTGTNVTLSTTADVNGLGTATFNPGAITLNNEYLFFQLEWQETSLGSTNGDNVLFRLGTGLITTTNFTAFTIWTVPAAEVQWPAAGSLTLVDRSTGGLISSGLQVQYPFENTVTADGSGNNNTGTLNGSYSLVGGKVGSAISFSTGYVSFSNTTNIGLATATSELSICCWIKTSNNNGEPIFGSRNGANAIIDLVLGFDGVGNSFTGKPAFVLRSSSGTDLTEVIGSSSASLADNSWHHVAVTRTSGKLITIYVDGSSVGSATDALTAGVPATTADTFVGREVAQGWQSVSTLDDFRYYNRALTATEVSQIAALNEPGGVSFSAVAQWMAIPASLLGAGNLAVDLASIHQPQTYQITSALAPSGALNVSLAQVLYAPGPLSMLGSGAFTISPALTMPAAAALTGAGALTGNVLRFSNLTAAAAGVGALTAPLAQWLQASSAFAPAATLAATATGLLLPTAAFAPTAALTAQALQRLAATAALPGAGAFAPLPDLVRLTGANIWTVPAGEVQWPGLGALTATSALRQPIIAAQAGTATLTATSALAMPTAAALSGLANLTATPTQALAFSYSGVGGGAATASLTGQSPLAAALAPSAQLTAQSLQRMAAIAALSPTAALTSSLSQSLQMSFAAAGVGGATSSLTQQLFTSTALSPVGSLVAALLGQSPLSSALAGSSTVAANTLQRMAALATLLPTGQLTALPLQWMQALAPLTGAGALSSFLVPPGPKELVASGQWSGASNLAVLEALRLVSAAAAAGSGALSSRLTASSPLSALAAGAGQLAASALQALAPVNAGLIGAGQLAATFSAALPATSGFAGVGALSAVSLRQWMAASSSTISGLGLLAADIVKLTGGQLKVIDQFTLVGTGALTAQTAQWHQGTATQLSGAGALTPLASTISTPLASIPLAGQGALTTSAIQRMSMVSAAAGAGALLGDLLKAGLTPLNSALAGAGSLAANYRQLAAISGTLVATGTLTAASAHRMSVGAVWSPAAALSSALAMTPSLASIMAGAGALAGDLSRALLALDLAATLSAQGHAAATLRATLATQITLAPQGALSAAVLQRMALTAVVTGQSSLLAGMSQFEQVAAVLTAAGFATARFAQIQQLDPIDFTANGWLSGDLIPTSIRVLTATILGRPSGNRVLVGRQPTAAAAAGLAGRPSGGHVIGRQPSSTIAGQDSDERVAGQGDFVTLH